MLHRNFLCLFLPLAVFASTDKIYGPFNLLVNNFVVCSGPKPKDCTILKGSVSGDTTIHLDLQVLKNCSPTKGKIVTSSNGKELTRMQMNKPCEHLFLRPLLTSLYNVTKNCMIMKGNYTRSVDIGQIANDYFGGNFFYGNLSFRSHLYNDDCNFSCTILQITMSPK